MKESLRNILKKQIGLIKPSKEEVKSLQDKVKEFVELLQKEIKKIKGGIDVFVGGSFAKGTMLKNTNQNNYDVDIFVRFDYKYDNISDLLEKCLKSVVKLLGLKMERIHGSRDYFRVFIDNKNYFEIIPVTKINSPKESRNVTDLSYFHVSYIKKRIKKLEDEVALAKSFMKASRVYGAETYVRGFSGYSVELLILHYRSFEKMLRELVKLKMGERIVIDIGKKYKKKEIFFEMNENKLNTPIVLVDPTYRERNALAALSWETFEKFQKTAKNFLNKPSEEFFIKREIDVLQLKKEAERYRRELIILDIETDKQEGDIAGTKMKKFSKVVEKEIGKFFDVKRTEFDYLGNKKAIFYLVVKSKKEVTRIGPPIHLKKSVSAFKKMHADSFEKNGFIHARIKVNFNAKAYLDVWKKGNKKLLEQMSIIEMEVN